MTPDGSSQEGNSILIYVVIYVLSLLLSAYFASSETAYTAVSKVRLRTMADKGNKRAKQALWISDRFDRTLSTILIGNNLFHATCASVTAAIAASSFLQNLGSVVSTLITTMIVYLVAEMIPKSLAKARSEELALFYAPSLALLVRLLTPISSIFMWMTSLMSRFFESDSSATVTEEELHSIIETIEDEGVLEPEKQALVNSAMEFCEKLAEDIMVPLDEVVSVPSTASTQELVRIIKNCSYSRIPVYEREKGNIVGILPANRFMSYYTAGKTVLLRKILMKPYVFDRKIEISQLLQRMRLNKLHMVFVVDEKKNKVGLITMEDLLEELVGDIQDETDAGEGLQLM